MNRPGNNAKGMSIFAALNASEIASDMEDGVDPSMEVAASTASDMAMGTAESTGGKRGRVSIFDAVRGGSISRGQEGAIGSGFHKVHGLSTSICQNDTGDPLAPCMKQQTINKAFNALVPDKKVDNTAPQLTNDPKMNTLIKVLGCQGEKCVAYHKAVKPYLGGEDVDLLFKPVGPKFGNEWLSNHDIEAVLRMYQRMEGGNALDFWKCTLMDYKGSDGPWGKKLSSFPEDKKLIVCVGNTGKGDSTGIHWVTMLVDMRNDTMATVEFFDSTGTPPQEEHMEWVHLMENELKAMGKKHTTYTNSTVFQHGGSECGVYSLYFVKARLEGNSFKEIVSNPIPDETMQKFRSYTFTSIDEAKVEYNKKNPKVSGGRTPSIFRAIERENSKNGGMYEGAYEPPIDGGKKAEKEKGPREEPRVRRKDPSVKYYRIDGGWNIVPIDPLGGI